MKLLVCSRSACVLRQTRYKLGFLLFFHGFSGEDGNAEPGGDEIFDALRIAQPRGHVKARRVELLCLQIGVGAFLAAASGLAQ